MSFTFVTQIVSIFAHKCVKDFYSCFRCYILSLYVYIMLVLYVNLKYISTQHFLFKFYCVLILKF